MTTVYAATMNTGSIELLTLPRGGDFVARGRARAEVPTELTRGWVYLRS